MRLISHKYLREADIYPIQQTYLLHEGPFQKLKEWLKCKKRQRIQIKTGVNPAETWDMETSFLQWLYETLRAYLDNAGGIVDLEEQTTQIEYKGSKYNLKQFIDLLLKELEVTLRYDDFDTENFSGNSDAYFEFLRVRFEKDSKRREDIHEMWKLLAPYAGW